MTTTPHRLMSRKLLLLVFTLIGLVLSINAWAQYTVESVPNPKDDGQAHYVSNPNGILRSDTVAQLDAISAAIEQNNGSEFAIVVVDTYQGISDFTFALDLFNHWGIGKQGANNGLLLFLAMDHREYRFITGYGIEGIFPDALLKRIGETYLVPYMRAGNTDMAVLATAKVIESVFLSPEHKLELSGLKAYEPTFWNKYADTLEKIGFVIVLYIVAYLWITLARNRVLKKFSIKGARYKEKPFFYSVVSYLFLLFATLFIFLAFGVLERVYQFKNLPYFVAAFGSLMVLFHYYGNASRIQLSTEDKKNGLDRRLSFTHLCLIPLLLSPLAYFAYFKFASNKQIARSRGTPPDASGKWSRLDRDTIDLKALKTYLSPVQRREEKLESKSYEIWHNTETGATHLSSFAGNKATSFTVCPKCHGQVLKEPETKVIKRPTYSTAGKGERIQSCAFCTYNISLGMVAIPVLRKASSSGGSSGGGGSSSSGGSFGGGSSGGGGAGGRW